METVGPATPGRDDFPPQVKRTLALRVAYRCSNPDCAAITAGPQADPEKAVNIGVAAHVTAAAPGGPRYNPLLSQKERRSPRNGIWLCQNCAKLVDNDLLRFTESALRGWKRSAEQRTLDQIGLPAGTERSKRLALWNVPFPRNLYFTGREHVLEEICLRLDQRLTVGVLQAITGLGGIGKTQTAVEYAYRYGSKYDAVLWVTADGVEQLSSDFVSIARLLDLPEKDAPDPQAAVGSVIRWLESTNRWLLIVDNADEPALVRPFLPARPLGHMIITSRVTTLDLLGVSDPVLLNVMDSATATAFIVARTGSDQDDPGELAAARELSRELGYLPLALEQAAAYIAETECLVQDYLKSFRERQLQLLRESSPVTGAYGKTVHSTWSLNFEEVQKTSPASSDVLRLAAFLAPDFIPEILLTKGASELGFAISAKLAGAEGDPLLIDDLLRPLVRYALAIRDKRSGTISVHRLVQAVVRAQMSEDEQSEWVKRAVRALNCVFPEASYDQWPVCDKLLPHARVAAGYVAQYRLGYEDVGFLLNETAAFMRLRADFQGSQQMHALSLFIRERDLPADHPAIAESLNDTGCLYLDLRRYDDAEPLFRKAVEISQRTSLEDDVQQVVYLNNLGRLYVEMGRCAVAEPLLQRAEAIARTASADDLYMHAVVLNNMAELYLKRGQLAEAEEACRRSLRMREKIGNPEKLARSVATLAEIQARQRDQRLAEDAFVRALELKAEVFGAGHPETIPVLIRYARLLSNQGRLREALELENQAERIRLRFNLPRYQERDCTPTSSE
jgi:tetratricopeptide (TPR) repeat protein